MNRLTRILPWLLLLLVAFATIVTLMNRGTSATEFSMLTPRGDTATFRGSGMYR